MLDKNMLECKMFEVLDRMTFIPVLAVQLNYYLLTDQEQYLHRRCGYSQVGLPSIILTKLQDGKSSNDVYDWDTRTMQFAHDYIEKNWEKLEPGQVIDVEYLLDETKEPKVSERFGN